MLIFGRIDTQSPTEIDSFKRELQALMYKYKVNRVEANWSVPEACPRCGEEPVLVMTSGAPAALVYEEIPDDDPLLKEPELDEDVESSEALGMLGEAIKKMPRMEINLDGGEESEDGE